MYSDTFGTFDIDEFAMRLWGNIYFDQEKRKFTRKGADVESKRSFVHFILEPLYKLYTQVSYHLWWSVDQLMSSRCSAKTRKRSKRR